VAAGQLGREVGHTVALAWMSGAVCHCATPRRLEELPVDDGDELQVLGAFAAWLATRAGARQRQQAALPPDAEIGVILLHRFLPPVPRRRLEAAAKKLRSATNRPILA